MNRFMVVNLSLILSLLPLMSQCVQLLCTHHLPHIHAKSYSIL